MNAHVLRLLGLCSMIALLFAGGLSAHAQESGDADAGQVSAADLIRVSQLKPDSALPILRNYLQDRDVDPRTRFALLLLLADTLETNNQLEQSRQALVAAARLAARNRGQVDEDIAAIWLRAANLAQQLGDERRNEEALQEALAEQIDTARPGSLIEATRTLIAEARARRDIVPEEQYKAPDPEAMIEPAPSRSVESGFRSVEVFYATDRAATGSQDPVLAFGGDRSDSLSYGKADVTIPETHKAGALESPSILKLEFTADPKKHVILRSIERLEGQAFFGSLKNSVTKKKSSEAFIYIHGFNQTFSQALRRAAQMAHDMEFEGVPIAYTWPSRGLLTSYIADTAVVRLSGRRLSLFLEDIAKRSGAERIHIIAHSMGNRALTDALELMALRTRPVEKPSFDQVVFAAPDVDAGLFAAMAQTAKPLARRMTLYASNSDWALEVSRKLHGNAPRAGQGGNSMLVSPAIDSVDMSALGDDMLAHSYFAGDRSALVDLASLFWRNVGPANRCGLRVAVPEVEESSATQTDTTVAAGNSLKPTDIADGLQPWLFDPQACDSQLVLPLLSRLRAKLRERQLAKADDNQNKTAGGDLKEMIAEAVAKGEADPAALQRAASSVARLIDDNSTNN